MKKREDWEVNGRADSTDLQSRQKLERALDNGRDSRCGKTAASLGHSSVTQFSYGRENTRKTNEGEGNVDLVVNNSLG